MKGSLFLYDKEVYCSEENVSAEKTAEKQGARLQKKNENSKRQKGAGPQKIEGQSKIVCVMLGNNTSGGFSKGHPCGLFSFLGSKI